MTSFRTRTAAQALLFALAASLVITTAHGADQKWWHTSSPNAAVNGQIVLKNGTGATRTVNNNPTGATLATRTANTQPPTVVVQATATLPVVAEGSACNNAVDTAAVNSDKTLILTCQSGVWKYPSKITPTQYVVTKPPGTGTFDPSSGSYVSYVVIYGQKFCSLSYTYIASTNDQSDCGVSESGSNWVLSTSTVNLNGYGSCRALCF